jgi:hypothetical protein
MYRDGLLPEDRYEDWASADRDALRLEYLAILEELAGLLESRGEIDAAIEVVRGLVVAEPLREDNHTTLIRLNALAGRRGGALRAYEQLRATLATEIGTEPGATAQRLFEEIRSRQVLEPELAADLWERVGDLRMLSGDAAGGESIRHRPRELRGAAGERPDPAQERRRLAHAASTRPGG